MSYHTSSRQGRPDRVINVIFSSPISQYDGAPGASIVGHMLVRRLWKLFILNQLHSVRTGGLLKSTSNMKGFIENGKDHESPFAMAHGISYWKWFEQPGNEMYFRRFSEVMKVINSNVDPAVFVSSEWSILIRYCHHTPCSSLV